MMVRARCEKLNIMGFIQTRLGIGIRLQRFISFGVCIPLSNLGIHCDANSTKDCRRPGSTLPRADSFAKLSSKE
jgi:hypothetical protein